MSGLLQDKVFLIVGIRNDLSLAWAVARAVQAAGGTVAASYTPETRIDVLALLGKAGMDPALAAEVDVRSDEQVGAFVEGVLAARGRIDGILHAVAFGNHRVMCTKPPGSSAEPNDFLHIPWPDLAESFDISVYSLLRICRAAAPRLQAGASILTLTYQASQRVLPGYAGMALNKAALESLVRSLAFHFGPAGVRVNALSAGMVMTSSAAGIAGVRTLRKMTRETAPLGNIKADDVGAAALYYFSELSARATGNIHYVDGGMNIMGVTSHGTP